MTHICLSLMLCENLIRHHSRGRSGLRVFTLHQQ
uniref:Uncharacterized protein n=2 Tax=Anguilla anguilla TaxID=7936 RepID=A0A0E9R1Z0_ANGAN